jgi:hypothetical protein
MGTGNWYRRVLIAGALGAVGTLGVVQSPASAGLRPSQSTASTNPTPLTDLFSSSLPPLTGGTPRACAVSGAGITVHCVENTPRMPSADLNASGVTLGHWIYCKGVCGGRLLAHEMIHVRQFETYGDTFGPMYLIEAAQHGDGCDNKYEREAYEATGGCP